MHSVTGLARSALALVLLWSGAAAASPTVVEGHVFAARTGRPLRYAFVQAYATVALCSGGDCSLSPVGPRIGTTSTDANGFYEFLLDLEDSEGVFLSVSCRFGSEASLGGASVSPDRDGVVRRDVYLDPGPPHRRLFCDRQDVEPH